MNKNTIAGIKLTNRPTYVSIETFPAIQWGMVAAQARNFTAIGQTMIIIAHSAETVHQAINKVGFGATVKATKIPFNFEVTAVCALAVGVKATKATKATETFKLRAVA